MFGLRTMACVTEKVKGRLMTSLELIGAFNSVEVDSKGRFSTASQLNAYASINALNQIQTCSLIISIFQEYYKPYNLSYPCTLQEYYILSGKSPRNKRVGYNYRLKENSDRTAKIPDAISLFYH